MEYLKKDRSPHFSSYNLSAILPQGLIFAVLKLVENQQAADAAKKIFQSKNQIIEHWEKLVRLEFKVAANEGKPELINSLPEFLDHLVDVLTVGQLTEKDYKKVEEVSLEHAEERAASTEFTIEHIVREYNILRRVIFKHLEKDVPLHR